MQLYVLARTCGVNWGIACVPIDMHVNARARLVFGPWHVSPTRTYAHARARFTHRHFHRCANMCQCYESFPSFRLSPALLICTTGVWGLERPKSGQIWPCFVAPPGPRK